MQISRTSFSLAAMPLAFSKAANRPSTLRWSAMSNCSPSLGSITSATMCLPIAAQKPSGPRGGSRGRKERTRSWRRRRKRTGQRSARSIATASCASPRRARRVRRRRRLHVDQSLALARAADKRGVDLAVFPELNISSYAVDDLHLQDAFLDAVEAGSHGWRRKARNCAPCSWSARRYGGAGGSTIAGSRSRAGRSSASSQDIPPQLPRIL